MKLLAFVSLALSLLAIAKPTPNLDQFGPLVTKHAWHGHPSAWNHLGPASDSHVVRMRIGLKHSNMNAVYDHLSDPSNWSDGHLSKAEVQDYVQPHPESVEAVEAWLVAHGLDMHSSACAMERSPAGDWISLNIPVRTAEVMLGTQYGIYEHKDDSSHRVLRTLSYALPASLHDHVDVVSPTTYFGRIKPMSSTVFRLGPPAPVPASEVGKTYNGPAGLAVPASCNTSITPDCLAKLYGTDGYVPRSTGENKLGITGYLEQYASFSDLKVPLFSILHCSCSYFSLSAGIYSAISSRCCESHFPSRLVQWWSEQPVQPRCRS